MRPPTTGAGGSMWKGRNSDSLAIEMARLGLRMFYPSTPWAGTVGGYARHNWLVQAGVKTGTAAGGGLLAVTFGKAFPTGLLTVVISPVTPNTCALTTTSHAITGFTLRRADSANSTITAGWLAIGW